MREIDPASAQKLIATGDVSILDVRTPGEFTGLGHIPGARLLPLQVFPAALADLESSEEKPLLVYCEHGIRSIHACSILENAGFDHLLNLTGGLATWLGPRSHDGETSHIRPSPWIQECADLLPDHARALDLACGGGRHALFLAAAGYNVCAVDNNETKVERLRDIARELGISIDAHVLDLETPPVDVGREEYDLILGFRYLHRPLFPNIVGGLKKGGILLYETFTRAQAERGHPKNPDFLLEPGELSVLCSELEILREREGEFDGAMIASIAARRN